jgi:hypothetical protein
MARAQSTVDFVVAIGVFVITLGFVLAFLPEMLAPFEPAAATPVEADRAASALVGTLVEDPLDPTALDSECTRALFDSSYYPARGCRFTVDETPAEVAGFAGGGEKVYVTLERRIGGTREVLCLESDVVAPCAGGEQLTAGPTPPQNSESVVSARRTVRVDGIDATMVVHVW